MKQLKPWLLLAGAAIVLAACGGGGDGGADPAPAPANPLDGFPVDAAQSISAWFDYIDRLIKVPGANGAEAVDLSAIASVTIPTDDTSEPVMLGP